MKRFNELYEGILNEGKNTKKELKIMSAFEDKYEDHSTRPMISISDLVADVGMDEYYKNYSIDDAASAIGCSVKEFEEYLDASSEVGYDEMEVMTFSNSNKDGYFVLQDPADN